MKAQTKIPEGWKVVELGDFIEVETGKRAKGGGLEKGDVPSIGGEHISKDGKILWNNNLKFIPENFYETLNQGKIKLGDILIVKDGATTGKVAIVKDLPYEKIAVNEHVFIIRSKNNRLLNDFIFYILFSNIGQIQIKVKFHGMIGGIRREDIKTIKIPLPPLPEQKAIAKVLSTVDEAIEKVNSIIEKTERLKKGLMQRLLTEGIGHKEFKDTEIGRIPKEWGVVRLGEVTEFKNGINFSKEQKGKKGILTIDVLNMYGSGIKLNFENLYRVNISLNNKSDYLLKKGDILFVRSSLKKEGSAWATLFNGYKEPVTFCGFIIRARLKNKNILPEFLTYYLRTSKIRNKLVSTSGQVTISNISQEGLKLLKIPLPPLQEQQKIAEILSTVDKKLELERKRKEKLERIKKGLMNDLLTGKIRLKISGE